MNEKLALGQLQSCYCGKLMTSDKNRDDSNFQINFVKSENAVQFIPQSKQ